MSELGRKRSEWIGVDLGTTKTVAAYYIGEGFVEVLHVVECNFLMILLKLLELLYFSWWHSDRFLRLL